MTTVGSGVPLAGLDVDPYPIYDRLRREEPVSWIPELGQWLVTGWREVSRVLSEPELFTTDIPESPMIRFCGGAPMVAREGADHRDIRDAVVHDYDPHRINDYVDAIVRPHAEKVADGVFATGHGELGCDYLDTLPLA